MDCYERIDQAVDFIERHLTLPLTLAEAARRACFSLFHFHRVFQGMVGCSVGEYVRGRRLYEAALDLRRGKQRILDTALKYQYGTDESFTRAFKRQYGLTPRQYRAASPSMLPFNRVSFLELKLKHTTGDERMEPKIVEKDAINLIGVSLRTTVCEGVNAKAIPEFWQRFIRGGAADRIPNRIRPDTLLGVCADPAEDGSFTYLIGAEVGSFDEVPEGMVARTVPPAKYAVFTSKGRIPESIQEMWGYAYGTWLPKSGFEHAGTEDFELYDERFCSDSGPEVDLYIPIR